MMDNVTTYLSGLETMGIQKGGILFVSSDVRRLVFNYMRSYREPLSLDSIINKLQQLVGEEGTLIFPTFNWDFCRGIPFDYHSTPCMTGSLSSAALKRNDFRRTQHPIYSYAVWGKYADELCAMQNLSSFGDDSVFGWLDKHHAQNLIIDVGLTECFTFVHYVEQTSGHVNYRFDKQFTAEYIDADGQKSLRTYSMFVRYLELDVVADFRGIDEILYNAGIEKRYEWNGVLCKMIDLHASVQPIMEDIINNRSRNLCTYKGQ